MFSFLNICFPNSVTLPSNIALETPLPHYLSKLSLCINGLSSDSFISHSNINFLTGFSRKLETYSLLNYQYLAQPGS